MKRPDGAVLAIEVKLGGIIGDDDVKNLHWLRERLRDRLLDAVVISTGTTAYRRRRCRGAGHTARHLSRRFPTMLATAMIVLVCARAVAPMNARLVDVCLAAP